MAKTKKIKAKKTDWAIIREQVKNLDKAILTKVVDECDGHTIYVPKHFIELGLPEQITLAFTRDHQAGDGKYAIFQKGKPVKHLSGIHGLQLVEFIASVFNVHSHKEGRGSRAAHLAEQLQALFKTSEVSS